MVEAMHIVMLKNIIQRIIFSFFKITVAILWHLFSFKTGSLTDRGNQPYMRRADLIDPTPILDEEK
jgi:hypothetical protein